MSTKKKAARKPGATKSSAKLKDMKPKKDAKGGNEVRRYDIVAAFPKKLEFGQLKAG